MEYYLVIENVPRSVDPLFNGLYGVGAFTRAADAIKCARSGANRSIVLIREGNTLFARTGDTARVTKIERTEDGGIRAKLWSYKYRCNHVLATNPSRPDGEWWITEWMRRPGETAAR